MAGCTLAIGRIIICMARVFTLGRMAECTRVNTSMTRSTVSECTLGLMDDSTTACGRTESSMEKVSIFYHQAFREEENGKMAIERDG